MTEINNLKRSKEVSSVRSAEESESVIEIKVTDSTQAPVKEKRKKKYDLYGGAKNKDEFIQKMQKKIKKEPPEINISDICEQYYHRTPFCNYPPESNKVIFRNALYKENEE